MTKEEQKEEKKDREEERGSVLYDVVVGDVIDVVARPAQGTEKIRKKI